MYTCTTSVSHNCPHKLTTDSLNYTKYNNTHKNPQPLVRSIYSWHWHTIIIKEWHTLGLFSSSDFWSSGNLLNLRSKIHLCSCLSSMQKFLRVRLTIQHLLPQVILMRKAPPSSSPTTWWKFSCSSSLKHACQTDKSLMRHVNWQNRSINIDTKQAQHGVYNYGYPKLHQNHLFITHWWNCYQVINILKLKKLEEKRFLLGYYCKI